MFNVLIYTEELERGGFSKEQAASSMKVLVNVMNQEFASKFDLEKACLLLKQDLMGEIGKVRQDLGAEIGKVRQEVGVEIGKVRQEVGRLDQDVKSLRSEMREEFLKVRSEMIAMESRLTNNLTLRMGGMMLACFSIFFAAVQWMKISI